MIHWFWSALRGFNREEKALFLQFVTGTSKVGKISFRRNYEIFLQYLKEILNAITLIAVLHNIRNIMLSIYDIFIIRLNFVKSSPQLFSPHPTTSYFYFSHHNLPLITSSHHILPLILISLHLTSYHLISSHHTLPLITSPHLISPVLSSFRFLLKGLDLFKGWEASRDSRFIRLMGIAVYCLPHTPVLIRFAQTFTIR